MIRDRAWRRYMEERIVIKRMKRACYVHYWRGYKDINDIKNRKYTLTTWIGDQIHFRAKTHTTTKWDSRHKVKYSPNKNKNYYRDEGKNSQTRESTKKLFLKILIENGLK